MDAVGWIVMQSMNLLRIACLAVASAALLRSASGQGFANLNFEQSIITSSSPSGYGFDIGTANVPGWTEYYGWGDANYSGGASLAYNNPTLDAPGVALVDRANWYPAVEGSYSILLQGGTISGGHAYGATNGAALGQTGRIPSTAHTISFWASTSYNSGLQVTFNDQILSLVDISNSLNYAIWGADISSYSGQTGELRFTATYPFGVSIIDNIQFSPVPIPEPSFLGLLVLVGLALCWHRRSSFNGGNS